MRCTGEGTPSSPPVYWIPSVSDPLAPGVLEEREGAIVAEVASGEGTSVAKFAAGEGTGVAKFAAGEGTGVAKFAAGEGTGVAKFAAGEGTGVAKFAAGEGTGVAKFASGAALIAAPETFPRAGATNAAQIVRAIGRARATLAAIAGQAPVQALGLTLHLSHPRFSSVLD
jgi:hypothetical protein